MKSNKKGFTIVELVIVVAIIAILAAVLIPTFTNIIRTSHISADTQLIRNLNTALRIDKPDGKHATMHEALKAAFDAGYDIGKINQTAVQENKILWDSKNDVFCYFDSKSTEANKIAYVPEFPGKETAAEVDYFVISATLDEKYSTYLYNTELKTVDTDKGVDVGDEEIDEVVYTNASGSVVIRTNGGSVKVVNGDVVSHYGYAESVEIKKVAADSYHEYGTVGFMQIAEGHIVAEAGSQINTLLVTGDGSAVTVDSNGAEIESAYTTQSSAKDKQHGGNLSLEYYEPTAEKTVEAIVSELKAAATMFAGGNGTQEKPYLIATAQHWNNMYVSLHEQAISETQLKLYFKLVNDIDFTNVALDTVHIDNDKVTFNLDGNNHKVSGIHDFTGERYVFYKIKDTDIKNITLSYNGENTWMGLSYSSYGGVTRITNVVTEGTIYATGGWLCSFITYPYGTENATGEDAYVYYKNCVNKTDHLGNAEYAAPFVVNAMTVKQISFENCSNTGTIAGQHASGFIGMTGGRTTQFEFVGENPAVNRGTIKTTSSTIGNARNFSTDEKKSGENYTVTVGGTAYIVNGSGATLSSVATLNVSVASEINGDITISNIADAEYYYVELTIARQGYNFNDSANLKDAWGGSLGSAELDFIVEKSDSDVTKLPIGKVYVCESDKDRVDWRNRDSVVDYKGLYYSEFNPEQGEVVVADDYEEIVCYKYDGKTFLYIDDANRFGALTQANQNGTNLNLTVSLAVYAYDAHDIRVGQKTVSYAININDAYNFFNGVENHFTN